MIILVGVPGCGKSTITKEILSQCPSVSVINYGGKMLEEAALQEESRDLLRKMPQEKQKQIGVLAAKRIVQEAKGVALIETQALIRTDLGYRPGLHQEVLEILSPKVCAVIECSPSLIIKRRASDGSRKRDQETEEELALHQELCRSFLSACCMATGSLLCRITNDSPSIAENARPLVHIIHSLSNHLP